MIPHYPPGVSDRDLEDDQHAALPDSDIREAEERDMRLEEKAEQREMDADRYEDKLKDRRLEL